MKTIALFTRFAQLAQQYQNCHKANNLEWKAKSHDEAMRLCKQYMPSGSGIDSGTDFDIEASNGDKLVFNTSFHHMNDNGFYDGWTRHQITVRPSLALGYTLAVSGRDRNQIKDYLYEVFSSVLSDEQWSLREKYLQIVDKNPAIKITSTWPNQCTQVWHTGEKQFASFGSALEYLHEQGELETV